MDRYTAASRANRLRHFTVFGAYRDPDTGFRTELPKGATCRGSDEERLTITFDTPAGPLTIPANCLVSLHEKFAANH